MKYYVIYRIDAIYAAEVEADSVEDAISKSEEVYMDADFGDVTEIVEEVVTRVENEDGEYIW